VTNNQDLINESLAYQFIVTPETKRNCDELKENIIDYSDSNDLKDSDTIS